MIFPWTVTKPKISVVVIAYNMRRELPRTLYSLSQSYQVNVDEHDYEVIVVDNGSDSPLTSSEISSFGSNFHNKILSGASPSPAYAVNMGVSIARANKVALLVDGARMLSPGFLHHALSAFNLYPNMVVATLGWHLGGAIQQESISKGYSQLVEDELLKNIGWQSNGYRLFDISTLAPSSSGGCFRPIAESNAFVVRKQHFLDLKGYDERFNSAGGGLVNLDFYKRAIEDKRVKLVMLAGEGSFHQVHGGISTNAEKQLQQERIKKWRDEYQAIRGKPYQMLTTKQAVIFGVISNNALPSIRQSIVY